MKKSLEFPKPDSKDSSEGREKSQAVGLIRNPQSMTALNLEQEEPENPKKHLEMSHKSSHEIEGAISEKSGEDGSEYGSESASKEEGSLEHESSGIKANPMAKDPFSLEPVDPKLLKKEKKLNQKEEDLEEDLQKREK